MMAWGVGSHKKLVTDINSYFFRVIFIFLCVLWVCVPLHVPLEGRAYSFLLP